MARPPPHVLAHRSPWLAAAIAAWRGVMHAHPMHLIGNDSIVNRCPTKPSDLCYGEPTPIGLKRLLQGWPGECALDEQSVFYDVGSGFGRLAAYVRIHTNASRVRGIEINDCRHAYALELQRTWLIWL